MPETRPDYAHDIGAEYQDLLTPEQQAKLSQADIEKYWRDRGKRPGNQSVLSDRYTPRENAAATRLLKRDLVNSFGDLIKGKRVFEMGVGVGRLTRVLATHADYVAGNDISDTMLARARRNLRGFPNVELFHGRLPELDLPPKSFDVVFTSLVLIHILNPGEFANTTAAMRALSDRVLILEHPMKNPTHKPSRFTAQRTVEEFVQAFAPFNPTRQIDHMYVRDHLKFMLFENKQT